MNAANQIFYSEAETCDLKKFFSPASFWTPDYLDISAWFGHSPFAFWLTEALSPKSFVELGTHNGFSYFTFCQAVQRLNLDMSCYAVDTWKGDEHSGFYGEDVFRKVSNYHERYSSFSRLVRSTFDKALEHFDDGSIDLLHIDGRHFYDDVKYDFETWLPKLSDRAVVLFHDTNVRERHFGVFSFWRELCEQYRHFEFIHDHGLGVLGVGTSLPDPISYLMDIHQDAKTTVTIREGYSRLGSSIRNQFQISQKNEQLLDLETRLNNIQEENQRLKAQLTQKAEETPVVQFELTGKPARPSLKQKTAGFPSSSKGDSKPLIYPLDEQSSKKKKPYILTSPHPVLGEKRKSKL